MSSAAVMAAFAPTSAAHAQAVRAASAPPRIAFNDVLTIQQAPAAAFTSEASEQIGAVVIRGNEAVAEEQYQQAIEQFFGEPITDEVLDRLTDELAQIAKDQGYPYVRAEIDREAAALGIVRVAIDEGRVDAIEIEGSENTLARSILQGLIGRPAKRSDVERALLLVSDIPAVRLRSAKLKRVTENGVQRGIMVVTLSDVGPSFRVAADNYGSDNFGPIRARVSAQAANVLSAGDQVRAAVRVNPIEPDELVFVSASYDTQLTSSGARLRASGSLGRTSPGDIGGDISGDTRRAAIGVSYPLKRTRKASAWIESDFSYISISQDDAETLLRDDTVVTASVGLRTRFAFAGGTARTGVTIERGLGILGATRLGDELASREDGDGVFTKVRFNANLRMPLVKRVSLFTSVAGQIADRPLLGPEEISLGGAFRTRGYNFAEVLGDEGVYGLAELRYNVPTGKLPLKYLQLYSFVDGGYVSDIDSTGSEGTLFSAGPGIRTRIGPLDFEVEGGFPLGGTAERSDDPNPQLNIRAGVNF